ncbi:4-alpha-glucanotransferase, chloroplastic/amyloplastic-like protein [Drosera capensis]
MFLLTLSPPSPPSTRLHHRHLSTATAISVRQRQRSVPRFKNGGEGKEVIGVRVGEDLPADYADRLPRTDPRDRRRAGILLHPTSLRGRYGIGDLGEEALRFVDWLSETGCSVWQVLPLVPPGRKGGEDGSPYAGQDANCGNTLLISLEELVKDGLLTKDELPEPINSDRVKYAAVAEVKDPLVAKAAERLATSEGELRNQLEDFRRDPMILSWLEDAAYFAAIDSLLGTSSWFNWPDPLKNRHLSALEQVYQIKEGFSRSGFPRLVSGVPPDAFSDTGQLWGSPIYDWIAMEKDRFSWWTRRLQRAQSLYDEFRIDHFRAFAGYWAVPSEAKFAMVGRWKAGPGKSLFNAIFKTAGNINIIAEDLGIITDDVVQLRKSIGAPGMAVLQFAFGSDAENPHLPHNHEKNQVIYTGTHDNDTVKGWWDTLPREEKTTVLKYLSKSEENDRPWELIRLALSSVAKTTIIPLQDVLALGSSGRMNIPGTQFGNWSWRIPASVSFESLEAEADRLRDMLAMFGRLPTDQE